MEAQSPPGQRQRRRREVKPWEQQPNAGVLWANPRKFRPKVNFSNTPNMGHERSRGTGLARHDPAALPTTPRSSRFTLIPRDPCLHSHICLGRWKSEHLSKETELTWQVASQGGSVVKNLPANAGDRFNPWARKIAWRKNWLPTPAVHEVTRVRHNLAMEK